VRRFYEVVNAIGRTGDEFVDPQAAARTLRRSTRPTESSSKQLPLFIQ
jgi:hypothetical protein